MSQYLVKYVMVASSTCGVTYIEYQSCLTNTEIYISVAFRCIALLSCSCYGLQKRIDICYDYEVQWDIKFNHQKSQAATFGGNSP